MSSLPLGSFARQCRPVLSCEPEPWTVASFWATWKSIVQGRSAAVSFFSASSSVVVVPVEVLREDAVLRGVVAERVEERVGHVGLEADGLGLADRLRADRPCAASECMPPQQISPSAASRSPWSFGDLRRPRGRSRRSSSGSLRDPWPSRSRPRGRVDADDAVGPHAQLAELAWRCGSALRTCSTNFLRSSSSPMAEPPPVGGQTGATTEPIDEALRDVTLSASFLRSSSVASMLTCGSKRKRSTPSNLTPLTSAAAVRSSIVSRSMQRLGARAALADEAGPDGVVKFGVVVLRHGLRNAGNGGGKAGKRKSGKLGNGGGTGIAGKWESGSRKIRKRRRDREIGKVGNDGGIGQEENSVTSVAVIWPTLSTSEFVLLVGAHRRRIGVHFRAEVPQDDQRLASLCSRTSRRLSRRLRCRRLRPRSARGSRSSSGSRAQLVHAAFALHGDEAVGAVVLDRALRAGLDGEFLRGEELLAARLCRRRSTCRRSRPCACRRPAIGSR